MSTFDFKDNGHVKVKDKVNGHFMPKITVNNHVKVEVKVNARVKLKVTANAILRVIALVNGHVKVDVNVDDKRTIKEFSHDYSRGLGQSQRSSEGRVITQWSSYGRIYRNFIRQETRAG